MENTYYQYPIATVVCLYGKKDKLSPKTNYQKQST